MNRKAWRVRAANEVNWNLDDVDATVIDEIGDDQNTILDTIHGEAPGAFVPDDETVFLYKDYTHAAGSFGGTAARYVEVTSDKRVLSFGPTVSGGTNPNTDGLWDGLYHIEVQTPDLVWHRRVCREFFFHSANSTWRCSIDRDWRNATDTLMPFRLYMPYFALRADATEIVDGQLYDSSRNFLRAMPEGWVHYTDRNDFQGRSKGKPEGIYRSKQFQLEAPNKAPTAALATALNIAGTEPLVPWLGPEPLGKLQYRITYVWGKRNNELVAPGGILDPTFESSPSPESSTVTVVVVGPSTTAQSVTLTLPEIDWMMKFNTAGVDSATHSGMRTRIYRRRYTATGAASASNKTNIESPEVYQLLAEVDGATTTYTDDGTVIPDYFRRLPESHGYYLWRVYPVADAEYQLDLRVRRKPTPLYNDYDAPRVDPTANEMLVLGLMAKMYRKKGNHAAAELTWNKFCTALTKYHARFASPAKVVPGTPWKGGDSPASHRVTIAPYSDT